MKTALLLAALLASTAAQAQTITKIARFDDHTVALSDMPCPASQWEKTAVYNSYGADRGRAVGCWSGSRDKVELTWFKVSTSRPLPKALPASDFQSATD